VQGLHRDYFRGVKLENDAKPGAWKQQDVVIIGSFGTVTTTPWADAPAELEAALAWLTGPGAAVPTYVRAAVFFHRFQTIHPFADGNGRVGRLLALWILSTGGLTSIRYCPIDDEINLNRHEYYASLNAADLGDTARWIGYFGAELLSGYNRAHVLGRRLQRIPPKVATASRDLLEYLYVHRIARFRVADIATFYLGAHRNTISRRLRELESFGLLVGRGRGAGRVYDVVPLAALS
jgi:Fic family protein